MHDTWDDTTGKALDPKEVVRARRKEMEIPRLEAMGQGIKIVKTRWIGINKGDRCSPTYRSRLVAKEFNNGTHGCGQWFAATPPLEAHKMLLSDAATVR